MHAPRALCERLSGARRFGSHSAGRQGRGDGALSGPPAPLRCDSTVTSYTRTAHAPSAQHIALIIRQADPFVATHAHKLTSQRLLSFHAASSIGAHPKNVPNQSSLLLHSSSSEHAALRPPRTHRVSAHERQHSGPSRRGREPLAAPPHGHAPLSLPDALSLLPWHPTPGTSEPALPTWLRAA